MALEAKIKDEVKLASTELINKSMILLSTAGVADETVYRIYCLLDKLRQGHLDEKTFEHGTQNPVYDTLETILRNDRGIDSQVRKLFLALYESYEGYCTQLISDHSVNKEFNDGMKIDKMNQDFNKKFSAFLTQMAFSDGTRLFPPASLKTVLGCLEETKASLEDGKAIDANSIYIILSFLDRKSKEGTLKKSTRELKRSMDDVVSAALSQQHAATVGDKNQNQKSSPHMMLFGQKEQTRPATKTHHTPPHKPKK